MAKQSIRAKRGATKKRRYRVSASAFLDLQDELIVARNLLEGRNVSPSPETFARLIDRGVVLVITDDNETQLVKGDFLRATPAGKLAAPWLWNAAEQPKGSGVYGYESKESLAAAQRLLDLGLVEMSA